MFVESDAPQAIQGREGVLKETRGSHTLQTKEGKFCVCLWVLVTFTSPGQGYWLGLFLGSSLVRVQVMLLGVLRM